MAGRGGVTHGSTHLHLLAVQVVGGICRDSSSEREKALMTAALPNLSALALKPDPTGGDYDDDGLPARKRERDDAWWNEWADEVVADANQSESVSRPVRRRVRRAREAEPSIVLGPQFLALPPEIQREVLIAVVRLPDPCKEIGRFCQVNKEFADMCRNDQDFWKSMFELKFGDEWRFKTAWFRQRYGPTMDSYVSQGFYNNLFKFLCDFVLTNKTIRRAIRELSDGEHTKYGPTNGWHTSAVTDMRNLFAQTHYFNQPIGNWDVSNVTNMSGMFYWAEWFNQPIGGWDVSKVEDMSWMFAMTKFFDQPIGKWDVSNVEDMSSMFEDARLFNQPIGNWDVSSVENMSSMFQATMQFNQPIGDWDVSNVTNMSGMFAHTYKFNQPIGNWDVSNVRNMRAMFADSLEFNQPIDNWDVWWYDKPNMEIMFQDAKQFNQPLDRWSDKIYARRYSHHRHALAAR